jgi:hypothetical protein
MTGSTPKLWLNRWAATSRRRGKAPGQQRPRGRLHLEVLEGRCLPSTVTNLNDSGPGSLRDALATTPAGGTVSFQPGLSGSIALTTGQLEVSHDLTIAGPGAGAITVSGSHTSRVFHIPIAATATISGLAVTNGQASDGGGISVDGALNLSRCVLSGNTASGSGGGLFSSGALSVADSTLDANHARNGNGGAVDASGTRSTFVRVRFQDNDSSSSDGGGGAIIASGALSITDCSFVGNTAARPGGNERGGAVWAFGPGSTLTISGSTFSGNTAGNVAAGSYGIGGAIHTDAGLTLANSTIVGNAVNGSGSAGGGGLGIGGAPATITSCTITGNRDNSGYGGGGITNFYGQPLNLRNTIVAGNTTATPANGPDVFGSVATAESFGNLIGVATATYHGPGNGVQGNQVGSLAAPIDPLLGPLQDNGGPTQTMALLPGSPALDAGNNAYASQWDQRGPRLPAHRQWYHRHRRLRGPECRHQHQ